MADWYWWQNRYKQGTVVAKGRMLSNRTVNPGYGVTINGVANNVGTNYSAFLIINNGGISYNAKINGGALYVRAGGTTSNTVVNAPPDREGHRVIEYVNGGKTYNTTILQGGQFIDGGGTTYNTLVTGNSLQTLSGGGAAYNTTINGVNAVQDIKNNTYAFNTTISNGTQYLSGGAANNTSIYAGGIQLINGYAHAATTLVNGGKVVVNGNNASTDKTVIGNNGSLTLSGGQATNTIVDKYGFEYISAGGIDTGAIVSAYGGQWIFTGGQANNAILNGGYQYLSGGTANQATLNQNAWQFVYTNGIANNTQINTGGLQEVNTGGRANYTTVNGGTIYTKGGSVYNALITNGGRENIYSGVDYNATISAKALQTVYGPGVAYNTTINATGSQYISNGGYAQNVTLNTQGVQGVYNGGRVVLATVNANASQFVFTGGNVSNTTINGGLLYTSGGSTYNAHITNAGQHFIYSGGYANSTTIDNGGITNIINGSANGTIINANGKEYISGGSLDTGAIVNSGGNQYISGIINNSYASATGTIIKGGGQQTIYDWARATGITLSGGAVNVSKGGGINGDITFAAGGTVNVYSGAGVSTAITNGGREYVFNGGWSDNTIVNNGSQTVLTGGKANNTTILNNGTVDISTGGIANSITVNNTGILRISGGTVNTAVINENGYTTVNGGTLSNYIITNGGIVNAASGTLANTSVTSGGSLIVATNNTTLTGTLKLDTGSYFNYRMALQNISINLDQKQNLIALLNDPTLFAPVGSTSISNLDTNKTQLSPEIVNTDKNTNSLNDLLNNPDYFAPVTASPQAFSLQTRDFIAPENDIFYQAPTTYAAGDTLNIIDNGDNTYTFTPPTHDSISGITTVLGLQGNSVSGIVQTGPTLIYGSGFVPTIPGMPYSYPIYVAENATVNLKDATNLPNVYIYDTATLNASNGSIGNLYVDNGGVANITDPATLTGILTLENGGKTNITTSTGGNITLQGTENKGLIISGKASVNGTTVASTINDFDGNDSLTLSDIQRSDVASVKFNDKDHVTITLKDGSSIILHIIDIETTGYKLGENSNGSVIFEVCFLAGTSISTLDGTIAIEQISIGDIVETFDWKNNQTSNASITWVGKKYMNTKPYLSDDLAGYPVRVLKNAISENIPNKDLLITPEHCLFFEGNFIPARMLVNGRSIYYDRSITSYDYYHIETEQHSVIRANGMLTESYLDTGNRNIFSNSEKIVSLFSDIKNWDIDGAAPLTVHREIVEPIYHLINKRALEINLAPQNTDLTFTNDPNLCLVTELGTIIDAHSYNNGKYIFNIPEGVNAVNLISRTSRPCETIGSFIDDRRELGVLVGSVFIINSNGIYEIIDHLSDHELAGWDVVEQFPCRWTNGKATLNIQTNYSEKKVLLINILAGGPYIKETSTRELKRKAS